MYNNRQLIGEGNSSGMAVAFDYGACPDEILQMLNSRQILIADLVLEEVIGKGQNITMRDSSFT